MLRGTPEDQNRLPEVYDRLPRKGGRRWACATIVLGTAGLCALAAKLTNSIIDDIVTSSDPTAYSSPIVPDSNKATRISTRNSKPANTPTSENTPVTQSNEGFFEGKYHWIRPKISRTSVDASGTPVSILECNLGPKQTFILVTKEYSGQLGVINGKSGDLQSKIDKNPINISTVGEVLVIEGDEINTYSFEYAVTTTAENEFDCYLVDTTDSDVVGVANDNAQVPITDKNIMGRMVQDEVKKRYTNLPNVYIFNVSWVNQHQ